MDLISLERVQGIASAIINSECDDDIFFSYLLVQDNAFCLLYDLCFDYPVRAAELIVYIGLNCVNDVVLERVVSGPLECLLERHGNEVIDYLMEHSQCSGNIREMLCGVTSTRISEDVYGKIRSMMFMDSSTGE